MNPYIPDPNFSNQYDVYFYCFRKKIIEKGDNNGFSTCNGNYSITSDDPCQLSWDTCIYKRGICREANRINFSTG